MTERAHPLAALAAASPRCEAVSLTALPPVCRLLIRGDAASIDLVLPDACRATAHHGHALLWLGPEEFLLLAADETMPRVAIRPPACIVDVSHRQTALSVSGRRADCAINAACALDLHPAVFPVGMCTRTVFGKAEIVLWRTADATFRIEVARSYAPYVWALLEEARREFLG